MSQSPQLKGDFGFALEKLVENEARARGILTEENESNINGHSDFYSDDEDGNGFGRNMSFENGFDAMEQREQERTENMLLETEFKLFHEEHNYHALKVAEEQKRLKQASEQNGFDRDRFRYYSMGYSANVDQVDDLEIARWQSRFPYFHVVGFGEEPREETKPSYGQPLGKYADEHGDEFLVTEAREFMIIGQKVTIYPHTAMSESIMKEYEGEIFESNGIEEEIFAIHYDPEVVEKANSIVVEVEPT